MMIAIWIIGWFLVVSLVGISAYVLATYLLLTFDRRLGRLNHLKPAHDTSHELPRGWRAKRAVIIEILATWIVAWIYLLGEIPPRIGRPRNPTIPILLVHGFNHNRSAWFSLKAKLARAGFGANYSLNLKRGNYSIADHAERLARFADRIEQKTGSRKLILIGHSMGGLVASHFAERLAQPGKVTHVITLASPLHGTRSAVLAGYPCAQEMRVGHVFNEELASAISMNRAIHYFHLATWYDNIIYPPQSALLGQRPGSERVLDDIGHMSLLFSSRVAHQIIDWLRSTVPLEELGRAALKRHPKTREAPASPNMRK